MKNKLKQTLRDISRKNKSTAVVYKAMHSVKRITQKCFLSDEAFIKQEYKNRFGVEPNLDNPQTFNEKMQWFKLYDHDPLHTQMADKYLARDYIADRIGERYLIPLLGVYNSFGEINFDALPDKFVLKCNHDCGSVLLCTDKSQFDKKTAEKILSNALKKNYFYEGREWPYKNIQPKIIAEKYMGDNLTDYKFMCFSGKVKCIFVCTDRFTGEGLKVTFFDTKWERLPFERKYKSDPHEIPKPDKLEEMISIAERLSANIPFLRVDLYLIDEKIYAGELTFFPGGGLEEFTPDEWDYTLGSWITLPDKRTD